MKILSPEEIRQKLGGLEGWALDRDGIRKCYRLESFVSAIRFVDRVAEAAEKSNHHPDILISYDKVTFTLITHDAGGITQRDFDMAGRIETIAGEVQP
jgi:4a-hydroxytetrahydrobiopterin dehydratase